MTISEVALKQTFAEVAKIGKTNQQTSLPNSGQDAKTAKSDPIAGDKAEISVFSNNSLDQFNVRFNSVLKSVRIADQAMEEVQNGIAKMNSEVQAFLKMYPPYPPGSEERVQRLKTITAIRQQIEKLSLPHDHLAGLILGKGANHVDQDGVTLRSESTEEKIRTCNVQLGPEGLHVPELPPNASDRQIAGFKAHLDRALLSVRRSRSILAQDTQKLIDTL